MNMKATPWRDLQHKLTRERRAEIKKAVERELLVLTLADLRRESGLDDGEVSETLEASQAELAHIDRTDADFLPTLRRYVEALGGELEVVAVFGNKRITLGGV
jgi:hypothetical protein